MWSHFTEISDNATTHFPAAIGVAARIDILRRSGDGRLMDSWHGPKCRLRLSDHAPVLLSTQLRDTVTLGERPVGRVLTRDSRFPLVRRRMLDLWRRAAEHRELSGIVPLAVRGAARIVRNWRRGAEVGAQLARVVAARAVVVQ